MPIKYQERKSNFIHPFINKTKDVICPQFYTLCWAHKCNFKCSYCFLALTFRYENNPVIYTNVNDIIKEVKQWLFQTEKPSVLNCGELADSFMLQSNSVLANLMDIFEGQQCHKLLFLTKSNIIPTEIEDKIYTKSYKQTIFSFSVNSMKVASLYEKNAPNPFERLGMAYRFKKLNQIVRVRIDPITEIENFKEEYKNVINVLNNFLQPERITLGSLRFFKNLPNFAEDRDVFKYGVDHNDGDGRLRLPLEKRVEMYQWFIDNLQCPEIGLCKETLSCYQALKSTANLKCNCMI